MGGQFSISSFPRCALTNHRFYLPTSLFHIFHDQVLCLLLEFLAQVAALSKVNEMTSEALAQVGTFLPSTRVS